MYSFSSRSGSRTLGKDLIITLFVYLCLYLGLASTEDPIIRKLVVNIKAKVIVFIICHHKINT